MHMVAPAAGAERLKQELAADVKLVQYASHGQQHHSNGVPLLSVLKAATTQPAGK